MGGVEGGRRGEVEEGAGGGTGEQKFGKNGRKGTRGKFCARNARASPRREEGDKGAGCGGGGG